MMQTSYRQTLAAKPSNLSSRWYLIDAADQTLGRLAGRIAIYLRGKHKPTYTPHIDTGDYIVVVNADKIKVTGNKATHKIYYRHTGYPGGIRQTSLDTLLSKHPERVIELAVKRMLPRGPLGRSMFRKLKVYAGESHPHIAQSPTPLSFTNPITSGSTENLNEGDE